MIILTIKTDQQLAEIGLFDQQEQLGYTTWEAHRTLTDTIHLKIQELLAVSAREWGDISGVVVYKGPGSFTGLRIGIAVANTIAFANNAAIVATSGDTWFTSGIERLMAGDNEQLAMPEYGADAHVTTPKK